MKLPILVFLLALVPLQAATGPIKGFGGAEIRRNDVENVYDHGSSDDNVADDTESIQAAIDGEARIIVFNGGKTNRVTGNITIGSNRILDGQGVTISMDGNFRPFIVTNAANVVIRNFRFINAGSDSQANQTPIRVVNSTNVTVENIEIINPGLNGMEVDGSYYVTIRNVSVDSPAAFGFLIYNSEYVTDTDCWVEDSSSWSHQFKSTKYCTSVRLRVVRPQTQYGIYVWTGFDSTTTPGPKLCEYNTYKDVMVLGTATTKHLAYVLSAPHTTIDGGQFIMDSAGAWSPVTVSGSAGFYNTGDDMTCDTTATSAVLANVTNIDQLAVGDIIRIGDVDGATPYTIQSIDSGAGTVTLTAAVATTATGKLIGFAAQSHYATLKDIAVFCGAVAVDGIAIAGAADYPIRGIRVTNARVFDAGNRGLYVIESEATISGLMTDNALEGARVSDATVTFVNGDMLGSYDVNSYGIVAESNSVVSINGTLIRNMTVTGVADTGTGGDSIIMAINATVKDCKSLAYALRNNGSIIGGYISGTRIGAGSDDGQIRVTGSGNRVDGVTFSEGSSTDLDSDIHEQAGASGNFYGPANKHSASFVNKVILASGSVQTATFWGGISVYTNSTFGGTVTITNQASFDLNATAGNTRFLIYDVDNATLERVSVGAADSGGSGFKSLRIPN